MHHKNIELLREEARRLINYETDILARMSEAPGVVSEASASREPKATFDNKSVREANEVLRGEQTKLNDLDLVLAVVGTMKAGKSTTINAIVGQEVLPNRNRPMTALPTLIRHTPGCTDPILVFDNSDPINQLIESLRNRLAETESSQKTKALREERDMYELITYINSHDRFDREFKGADQIFTFLKRLNDLVRLASYLDVDFPFSDYDEIHELPVINVEFSYLRDSETTAGRLTLLDTPGPNEAGQQHLKTMLKEQLSRASAVMAVLDYTQLKSDADHQVRHELESIAELSAGRMYALVNKFDQKDRHSDKQDEVCGYVSDTLMKGSIPRESVFAVSALYAYLASQTLSLLQSEKKLQPSDQNNHWLQDFARFAFGEMWDEEDFEDKELVRSRAKRLWKKSLFTAPLEQVIKSAHAGAALLAVQSAADKIVDTAERLNNFVGLRQSALLKSGKELEAHIMTLKSDIDSISETETQVKGELDQTLTEASQVINEQFHSVQKQITDSLDELFASGKAAEKQEIERENAQGVSAARQAMSHKSTNSANARKWVTDTQVGPGLRGILHAFFGEKDAKTRRLDERLFDPENPIIELKDDKEAEKIRGDLEHVLDAVFKNAETNMHESIENTIADFDNEAARKIRYAANKIKERIDARLAHEGLEVSLRVPRIPSIRFEMGARDLLTDMVEKKEKNVKRSRVKDSWFSRLTNIFNESWGRETYEGTEQYFRIDMDKVRQGVNTSVNAMFKQLDSALEDQLEEPLAKAINGFFSEFRSTVEAIRADLRQSVIDKQKEQGEQDELHERLSEFRADVEPILSDGQGLRTDIGQGAS